MNKGKCRLCLYAADSEIALLSRQMEALKQQKRGLMQKLLTGQMRVKATYEVLWLYGNMGSESRVVAYVYHASPPRLLRGGCYSMTTITLDVPDELAASLRRAGDRLPELLALSLQQHTAGFCRICILDFLASRPTAEQIAAFGPTPDMTERLRTLLARQAAGDITAVETTELDEYERIEYLMILIKAGNFPSLTHQM